MGVIRAAPLPALPRTWRCRQRRHRTSVRRSCHFLLRQRLCRRGVGRPCRLLLCQRLCWGAGRRSCHLLRRERLILFSIAGGCQAVFPLPVTSTSSATGLLRKLLLDVLGVFVGRSLLTTLVACQEFVRTLLLGYRLGYTAAGQGYECKTERGKCGKPGNRLQSDLGIGAPPCVALSATGAALQLTRTSPATRTAASHRPRTLQADRDRWCRH